MGTSTVAARWTGEQLNFTGVNPGGHSVLMGKDSISPSQLMLRGLAGCTGMDVVSILQKRREDITDLEFRLSPTIRTITPNPTSRLK
jgi:putative redox protein